MLLEFQLSSVMHFSIVLKHICVLLELIDGGGSGGGGDSDEVGIEVLYRYFREV